MSYMLFCIIIIALLWHEWELVKTSLAPIIDIAVAVFFIIMLCILIVVEIGLIVIAPTALFLGYESRDWHIKAARILMFVGSEK